MIRRPNKRHITLVETTFGAYGNYNSGSNWQVRLSDNPDVNTTLPRKRAKRLLVPETRYVIENFSAVYRFKKGERLVNIKYVGFKKPEVSQASTIENYIQEKRQQNRAHLGL